jgi:hypothetical protein
MPPSLSPFPQPYASFFIHLRPPLLVLPNSAANNRSPRSALTPPTINQLRAASPSRRRKPSTSRATASLRCAPSTPPSRCRSPAHSSHMSERGRVGQARQDVVSSSNHPEPLSLTLLEHQAHPVLSLVQGGGKMHRLLRSAFKRGCVGTRPQRVAGRRRTSWAGTASESSSLVASSGHTLSRRQAGWRGGDDSYNSDQSSRQSFEVRGETLVVPCF